MRLILTGTSTHTSPLAFRERLPGVREGGRPLVKTLLSLPGVSEGVLLSTCNRFETYLVTSDADATFAALHSQLRVTCHVSDEERAAWMYDLEGKEVVRHLFRVASSLDSMVVGEPQILGQVKQAYAEALEEKATGPIANVLFQTALMVAKRVRSETGIARNPISIPQVAVRFAEHAIGDLAGRTVLLLGAGKMGSLTAENLKSRGLRRVIVVSRSEDTAGRLAQKIGAEARSWDHVPHLLGEADILLCATDSPRYVLRAEDVAAARPSANGHRLLAVDIAVPRNLDPAIGKLPGVSLFGIEDLAGEVERNRAERAAEARASENLIDEELARFLPSFSTRGVELAASVTTPAQPV